MATTSFNMKDYIRNATRSIGFVVGQSLKDMNPAIAEFKETNSEIIKEMYSAVVNYKKNESLNKLGALKDEYKSIATDTVRNFFDDLKTGKFYNEDRVKQSQDKQTNAMMGLGDDDWDFDFDDIDEIGDNKDQDPLTGDRMDHIGGKISSAVSTAAMRSADFIVKSNNVNFSQMMAHNESLFGRLNNSLLGVHNAIMATSKASTEAAINHYDNSTKFYDYMTKQSAEQTGYLKQIYELLNNRFNPTVKDIKSKKLTISDIIGANGTPDLARYFEHVKSNVKNSMSMITSISDMFGSMGGSPADMIRSMLSSPVASLMKLGSNSLINKYLGKELESLNKTIGGLFSGGLNKLSRAKGKGIFAPIIDFAKSIFGIKSSVDTKIDTSKYNKDRQDWTGKDSKALQEVIPTQLSKILAALTGESPTVYDYNRGKWTNINSIKKDFDNKLKSVVRSSTYEEQDQLANEFLEDAKSRGKNVTKNSKSYNTFTEDLNKFFRYLSIYNYKIPEKSSEWGLLQQSFTNSTDPDMAISKSNFVRIKRYYQALIRKRKLDPRFHGKMMESSANLERFYRESEGDSSIGLLYNNSGLDKPIKGNNKFTNLLDNKGNSIFFYLQNFYSDLKYIANNISSTGTKKKSKKKNKSYNNKSNHNNFEVPDNNIEVMVNHQSDMDDEEDLTEDNNNSSNSKSSKIKDRIEESIKSTNIFKALSRASGVIGSVIDLPAKSLRSIIDRVDENLYRLIFGNKDEHGDKYEKNSIIEKLRQGFEDSFNVIKDNLNNLFNNSLKPIFTATADHISKTLSGEYFGKMIEKIKNSGFVSDVKRELKSAGKWVKNAFLDGGDLFGRVVTGDIFKSKPKASSGGHVTKSGLIAVSEGELVIPGDMNPYYNGRYDRKQASKNEQSIINKFISKNNGAKIYGGFSDGGTVGDIFNKLRSSKKIIKNNKNISKKDKEKLINTINQLSKDVNKVKDDSEKLNDISKKVDDFIDSIASNKNSIRDTKAYKTTSKILTETGDTIVSGFKSVVNRLFGKAVNEDGTPVEDGQIDKELSEWSSNVMGEVKKYAPSLAAGGIIGAGAFTIGGLFGGPLLGALAGATVSMAIKSEKFQNYLFGTEDKDGNQISKGLFDKKYKDFFKKNSKMLAKYGISGGALGLLGIIPGGPIMGIMAGSALGFAMENGKARDYLFGKNALLGKDLDKKLKKSLPKALAGSAALAFTGPFGLVGNLMLGAGIGFLSDTDAFKKTIFGTKDVNGQYQGGLLGILRKQVVDPLSNYIKKGASKFGDFMKKYLFEPLSISFRAFKDIATGTIRKVSDSVKNYFLNDKVGMHLTKIFSNVTKPLTSFIGKLGKTVVGVVTAPIKIGGTLLRKTGEAGNRFAIKHNMSSLSAAEKLQFMGDRKYDRKDYDTSLANASYDELTELSNLANMYKSSKNGQIIDTKKVRNDMFESTLANTEWDTSLWQDHKLKKLLNSDDREGLDEYLQTLKRKGKFGIGEGSDEKFNKFKDVINDNYKKLDEINSRDTDQHRSALQKRLDEMGLKTNVDDFIRDSSEFTTIEKELGLKGENREEEVLKNKEEEHGPKDINETVSETGNMIDNTLNKMYEKVGGIFDAVQKIIDPNYKPSENKESEESSDAITPNETEKEPNDVVLPGVQKDKPLQSSDNKKVEIVNGRAVEYVKDSKGDWKADTRDSETREAEKERKEENQERKGIFSSLKSVPGIFNDLKTKLVGDGSDKKEGKGIFGKLLDFLNPMNLLNGGIGGVLKWGLVALSGFKIMEFINNNPALKEAASKVFGGLINMIGSGIKGLISSIFNKNSKLSENLKDAELSIRGKDKTKYKHESNIENTLVENFHEKFIPRVALKTARRITGGKGVIGGIVKVGARAGDSAIYAAQHASNAMSNVGKSATSAAVNAGKEVAENVVENATKNAAKSAAVNAGKELAENVVENTAKNAVKGGGIITKVINFIKDTLEKVLTHFKIKDAGIADNIAQSMLKAIKGKGLLSRILNAANEFLIFLTIGKILLDAEQGFEGARYYLAVSKEYKISFMQRVLCAAVHATNMNLPLIGGLVNTADFMDMLIGFFPKLFGQDLINERKQFAEQVKQYNNENGTTYSPREYLKEVDHFSTSQDKIAGAVGGIVKGTGKLIGGAAKFVWDRSLPGMAINAFNHLRGKDLDKKVTQEYTDEYNKKNGTNYTREELLEIEKKRRKRDWSPVHILTGGIQRNIVDKLTNFDEKKKKIEDEMNQLAKEGKVNELQTYKIPKDINDKIINPITRIRLKMFISTLKAELLPKASMNSANTNTKDDSNASYNKNLDVNANIEKMKAYLYKKYVKEKSDLKSWNEDVEKFKLKEDGSFNSIMINQRITSAANSFMFVVNCVLAFGPISDFAADWFGLGKYKNADTSTTSTTNTENTSTTNNTNTQSTTTSTPQSNITGQFKTRSASSYTDEPEASGAGSGVHVSQKDDRFSNMRFGSKTVGDIGCGPAAAATVLRSYGMNGNLGSTIKYASLNGYVGGDSGIGTKASYFGDIFSRNGISSSYTDSKTDIVKSLQSGNPTVLLGQDKGNTSKSNSPFGPANHYVVAQGMDRNGNVLINDPEMGAPTLYNKNILNKIKLGVMTGGRSDMVGTKDESGKTITMNDVKQVTNQASTNTTTTTTTTPTPIDGDYIGKFVKEFESGNKGSESISTGKGDPGGASFGSYQFPSVKKKSTSLWEFWEKYYKDKHPGLTIGNNDAFKAAWLEEVQKDPAGFAANEHKFIADAYYVPFRNKMKSVFNIDLDTFDRAAQEAGWAHAVMRGPETAVNLYKKYTNISSSDTPQQYIDHLYAGLGSETYVNNGYSDSSVRKGILERLSKREPAKVKPLVGNKPIDPYSMNGVNPTMGGDVSSEYGNTNAPKDESKNDLSSQISSIIKKVFSNVTSNMEGPLKNLFTGIFGEGADQDTSLVKTPESTVADSSSSNSDMANNFPYYAQSDARWGSKMYGQKTISETACGPTSMAMVLKAYGKDYDPPKAADWSVSHGFRTKDQGTSWGYFKAIGADNNLNVEQFEDSNRTMGYLKQGIPVIASMKPGDFTRHGHFIVLTRSDGSNILVNDPGKKERTHAWDANTVLSQAKQYWAVSNNGVGPNLSSSSSTDISGAGSGLIDFTKHRKPKSYNKMDISRMAAKNQISNVSNKIYGGESGLDQSSLVIFQAMLSQLQNIANNTSYNINLASIVDILKSMMQIISNTRVNNNVKTYNEQKRSDDMEDEMRDVMNKINALARPA